MMAYSKARVLVFSVFLVVLFGTLLIAPDEGPAALDDKATELSLARKALLQAAGDALRMKNPQDRDFLLSWIAVAQAKAGDSIKGVRTATSIKELKERALTIAAIARVNEVAGNPSQANTLFQRAHEITISVQDSFDRAMVLAELAQIRGRSSDKSASTLLFKEALAIVNNLDNEHDKASAHYHIGASQLVLKDNSAGETFKRADKIIVNLPKGHRRYSTAFLLLPLQATAGDALGAIETANVFTDEADDYEKSSLLESIACSQADSGNVDGSLNTLASVSGERRKGKVLSCVTQAQAKSGDIEAALRTVKGIADNDEASAYGLVYVAIAQAKAGSQYMAAETIGEAIKAYARIKDDRDQALSTILLSKTLIDAGLLREAETIANLTRVPSFKAITLQDVAVAHAKVGNRNEARRILAQAREIEERPKPNVQRERLAEAYGKIGDFKTALEIAGGIKKDDDKSYALEDIARSQALAGDSRGVLQWAKDLKLPRHKAHALLGLSYGILERHGINPGKYF